MNENIFTLERIQILDSVSDWKKAIQICAKPLLEDNSIKQEYVDSIISTAENLGPFFDIGKNVAMPHSRPENGVNKKSISILKLNESVNLLDLKEHPIQIFILLAAQDDKSHVSILSKLSEFLIDDEKVNKLKQSKTSKEIFELFEQQ